MMKNIFFRILIAFLFIPKILLGVACPPQPPTKGLLCGTQQSDLFVIGEVSNTDVDIDLNSKRNLWSGFICPKVGKWENKLLDLDLESGRYVCGFQDPDSGTIIKGVCEYTNRSCVDNANTMIQASEPDLLKIDKFQTFGMVSKPVNITSWWEKYMPTWIGVSPTAIYFDFSNSNAGLIGLVNEHVDKSKSIFNKKNTDVISVRDMASKYNLLDFDYSKPSESHIKFSEFVTGLITLDSDFVKGVDQAGAISYDPKIETELIGSKAWSDKSISEDIMTKIAKNVNTVKAHLTTLSDIFDKKTWGYYAANIYNFNLLFQNIVIYFFMLGGAYLILHIAYMKIVTTFTGEQEYFRFDTYNRLILVAIAFTFFSAPVFKTGFKIDNNELIAQPSANGKANVNSYSDYSTIYQEMIRYFAQISNHFADNISAYATYSYVNFLESRNDLLANKKFYLDEVRNIYLKMKYADMYGRLYRNVCKPLYPSVFESGNKHTFLVSYDKLKKYAKVKDDNPVKQQMQSDMNIDWVDLRVCQNAELKSVTYSKEAIKKYFDLIVDLRMLNTDITKRHAKTMNVVVDNMFRQEASLGWINSISIPFSYYIFEIGKVFSDSKYKDTTYEKLETFVDNFEHEDIKIGGIDSFEEGVSQKLGNTAGRLVGWQALNVFPGFKEIRETVNNSIRDFLFGIGGKEEHEKIKEHKITNSPLWKIVEKLKGSVLSEVDGIITFTGGWVYHIAKASLSIAALAVSYYLAMIIYMIVVKMLTVTVIAILGLVRVLFYFISLLKYFIISPLIVLWSVTTGQGGKAVGFVGQGLVLMFQPMLIVVSVILFIFSWELVQTIFSYTIHLFLNNTENSLYAMSIATDDNYSVLYAYGLISAVKILFEVILSLLGILLAYKLIFSDEWFMRLFGYEGNIGGAGSARGFGESAGRLVNPIS